MLHPEYPPEGVSRAERYARRGITAETDPMRQRFEAADLVYNPPPVIPNTILALRLTELAREEGHGQELHDRLMDAYWVEGRDIGSADELRGLAAEVGVDDVDHVLAGDAYADVVEDSTRRAVGLGVTGVPAFVIDRRLLVLGAQPRPVFVQAFAQLGA